MASLGCSSPCRYYFIVKLKSGGAAEPDFSFLRWRSLAAVWAVVLAHVGLCLAWWMALFRSVWQKELKIHSRSWQYFLFTKVFRISRGALRPAVPRPAGGRPGPAQGVPGPAGRRQHLRLPGDTAAPDSGRAAAAAAANNRQRQRRRRRRTPFWGNIRGRQRS